MTLDISHERIQIHEQVNLIFGVGFRMPKILANHRELTQIQVLLKLIGKHLHQLKHLEKSQIEGINLEQINSYSQAHIRIKNHMIRKGSQIKRMMNDEQIKPYALLALKSLSSILASLQLIERKIGQLADILSSSPQKTILQQF